MVLTFLLSFSMSPITISIILLFQFLCVFVMVVLKSVPVHLWFVSTDYVLSLLVTLSCFAAV